MCNFLTTDRKSNDNPTDCFKTSFNQRLGPSNCQFYRINLYRVVLLICAAEIYFFSSEKKRYRANPTEDCCMFGRLPVLLSCS